MRIKKGNIKNKRTNYREMMIIISIVTSMMIVIMLSRYNRNLDRNEKEKQRSEITVKEDAYGIFNKFKIEGNNLQNRFTGKTVIISGDVADYIINDEKSLIVLLKTRDINKFVRVILYADVIKVSKLVSETKHITAQCTGSSFKGEMPDFSPCKLLE